MIRYLRNFDLLDLENQVNELIKTGWTPLGSVTISRGATTFVYIQTLVKMNTTTTNKKEKK